MKNASLVLLLQSILPTASSDHNLKLYSLTWTFDETNQSFEASSRRVSNYDLEVIECIKTQKCIADTLGLPRIDQVSFLCNAGHRILFMISRFDFPQLSILKPLLSTIEALVSSQSLKNADKNKIEIFVTSLFTSNSDFIQSSQKIPGLKEGVMNVFLNELGLYQPKDEQKAETKSPQSSRLFQASQSSLTQPLLPKKSKTLLDYICCRTDTDIESQAPKPK